VQGVGCRAWGAESDRGVSEVWGYGAEGAMVPRGSVSAEYSKVLSTRLSSCWVLANSFVFAPPERCQRCGQFIARRKQRGSLLLSRRGLLLGTARERTRQCVTSDL